MMRVLLFDELNAIGQAQEEIPFLHVIQDVLLQLRIYYIQEMDSSADMFQKVDVLE